jgi:FKBP-type peptidyl-prolyl cis-trans isomerase FkpA
MIQIRNINLFLVLSFIFVFSCRNGSDEQKPENPLGESESLMKVNRYFVEKDAEIIESFVKRRNWQMDITESGLWYMVYEKGHGPKAAVGKVARIEYRIFLLDGTICYNSERSGPKQFTIGRGGVESGLEEGILMLRTGDKARFILPPHLAYGLVGDENKIPPRSVIVYELEVVDISDP